MKKIILVICFVFSLTIGNTTAINTNLGKQNDLAAPSIMFSKEDDPGSLH
ncbi:hypothetical protein V1498_06985 [Peribacillus sp. SCS-26]